MSDTVFVQSMKDERRKNIHKGIWSEWEPSRCELYDLISKNLFSVSQALANNQKSLVDKHCADLANFAMKTAERFGTNCN